jgi:hypothetical protein
MGGKGGFEMGRRLIFIFRASVVAGAQCLVARRFGISGCR